MCEEHYQIIFRLVSFICKEISNDFKVQVFYHSLSFPHVFPYFLTMSCAKLTKM